MVYLLLNIILSYKESTKTMRLDDHVVSRLAVSKVFRDNTEKINCLDFSPDGHLLISSSDDDSIIIYDCQTGSKKRQVNTVVPRS